ncbi:Inositolphosphorylceramide synthase subunit Kei1-domain-containing protein [Thelephora terrestris]|uniref:Inositolphosphorylceramide synthase subunit Kei1-domain-containing protein n=1 Tax=Thelephora terrestris TaxID=56493 RepID=A0A9P6HEQ9_9AGAM|nr:Inositolphosphorylceramide synthase subunit Kei1-domain-containing protein [Thelephora terrestris]
MKLMLRPEWKPRPFSSFLGCLDLKTGVVLALLFALFNKVAGVYGLIAVLTGAGSSAAQLSLYIYSTVALVALAWGLNAVKREDPKSTLYFAHLFFADHVLSTSWTIFFAVVWWLYSPHDGRRVSNSAAQANIIENYLGETENVSEEERARLALQLWKREKGAAIAIIVLGWLIKLYLAATIYSYALHLRKGTYRNLPLSRPNYASDYTEMPMTGDDDDDDDIEDGYRVPGSSSNRTSYGKHNAGSYSRGNFSTAPRRGHKAGHGSYSLSAKSHPMSRSGSGRVEDGPSDILFDGMENPLPKQGPDDNPIDRQV